ncbi:gamma-glutamyltransferase family protein [Sulfitobacter sp. LCG007]
MRDFHLAGRSPVLATNGMCATSHPLAARTAIDMLARGGNAMDAAIAGAVLLGLCEPQMTGIGGDCFVLWSDGPDGDIQALNGSGRAPAAADAAVLRDMGDTSVPVLSPHAVTIPGAVDAFCHLAASVGKLGLQTLLAPAIRYAEEGIPVAPRVAADWHEADGVLQGRARDLFLTGGKALRQGELFRAPGQAEVLRRIAAQGRAGFYEGEVAEDMVASLRAMGGLHSLEDFAATACTPTQPVSGTYGDFELVEHAPNGQGATAILMLNILAQFDIASLDPLGAERAHLEAEAAKLAYDARDRFIADMDYTTRLAHMLDMDTAQRLAALIDPKRAMASAKPLTEALHKDTIYITVVDGDGMSVSLIYSIFHGFGSGIASDRFGILFQNRGAGFTLEQGHPNELGGGKRPMHTIIPAMLRRAGRVAMPFGVMGGAYQPTGHARMVQNLADFGMDPQSAIDAPRCFSGAEGMQVERGYSAEVRESLADMGHRVSIPDSPLGGAQAILIRDDGLLEGASDPRKDGCALGY